jgi:hypothetical protein
MTSQISMDFFRTQKVGSLSGSSIGSSAGSGDGDGDNDFAAMLKQLNSGTSTADTLAAATAGGAASQQLTAGSGLVSMLAQDNVNSSTQDALTNGLDLDAGSSSSSSFTSSGSANGRWLASLYGGSDPAVG